MKQPSLFDIPEIHIDKPIRLIELFGGIGAQAMALRDIGADFEHYRLIEFDKYPVQATTRYTERILRRRTLRK